MRAMSKPMHLGDDNMQLDQISLLKVTTSMCKHAYNDWPYVVMEIARIFYFQSIPKISS